MQGHPSSEAIRPGPTGPETAPPLSLREFLGAAGGFTLLTLLLTSPQIEHLGSTIGQHYDSLFSTWRLAWIAHQLPRDPLHFFDANIFYPQPGTLSYSDALLLPGLLGAPLIWLGLHPVVVHNLLVLASFVACGTSMYCFVRTETQSVPAAWFAGTVFAFQAYRFAHYAQLELLWSWPIPLALWALTRVLNTRRGRDGLILGSMVALQALSCLYYAVFLVTALLVLTIVRLVGQPWTAWRALVRPALAATLVCAAIGVPYSIPYRSASRPLATRTVEEVREWSPPLRSYLTTPNQHWLYGRALWSFGNLEHVLFPGVTAVCVAFVGAVMGVPARRRRAHLAYVVLLVVAVDLSLGFNGLTYRALYNVMWPFHPLRVPARMFVIVSAAMAVLGGHGVTQLLRRIDRPRVRRLLPGMLVTAVVLESVSVPIPLVQVPSTPPAIYRWLNRQPEGVVMEWPVPRADSLGVTYAPLFMYYSTFHWHPLINGYSGFYPLSHIKLLDAVLDFPDDESVRYLQRVGVRYVIVHSRFAPDLYRAVQYRLQDRPELKLIIASREEEGEASLYELASRP